MRKWVLKNKYLLLIIFLASFLRIVGLMPNVRNADEGFVQLKTWDLILNFLTSGDINPHTFKYGTLFFYFQAASYLPVLLGGYLVDLTNTLFTSSFTSRSLSYALFHEEAVRKFSYILTFSGRAEVALFGIASVFLVYLIGKRMFGEKVGLFSALFFSVAPLHVRDSHYITTDVPSLFFILLSFLFMVYIIEFRKLKWFILSGFFLGISATIRFYPIAFLAYPFSIIFSFVKEKTWFLKVLVSAVFIFLGVFIGLLYLFLDANGPALFMEDLTKYALPWYSTSISNYVFSLINSLASGGAVAVPTVQMLYPAPDAFRPVHASWIFFNAFGILPTIVSLIGIIFVFFKSFKKFILLIVIPVTNFIYISSFIPATYERLIIPTLPFLAIFVGLFLDSLNKKITGLAFAAILLLILASPLLKSFSASLSCAQPYIQTQSAEWVDKNISQNAKIGYLTMVSVPGKNYGAWKPLEPGQKLSLEEALAEGLDHAFISAGRLDYNTYPYFNSFFVPPALLYENSYYFLVLSEYHSRAKLLGKLDKPWMCDNSRIYYYKLPEALKEPTMKQTNFDFKKKENLESWQIRNYDSTGYANISLNTKHGRGDDDSLEYSQSTFKFTAPRIMSKRFSVREGKVYTFSAWIKGGLNGSNKLSTIVARVDFYNDKPRSLSSEIRNFLLLISEGPTPLFFEKKQQINQEYSNIDLPGKAVALSPLTEVNESWKKISVTAQAPEDTNFAILSMQPISTDQVTIYLDDIELLSN